MNHIFPLIIDVIIGGSFHLISCGSTTGCQVLKYLGADVLGNIILEVGEGIFAILSQRVIGSIGNGTLLNQLCLLQLRKSLLQMEIIGVLAIQNKFRNLRIGDGGRRIPKHI